MHGAVIFDSFGIQFPDLQNYFLLTYFVPWFNNFKTKNIRKSQSSSCFSPNFGYFGRNSRKSEFIFFFGCSGVFCMIFIASSVCRSFNYEKQIFFSIVGWLFWLLVIELLVAEVVKCWWIEWKPFNLYASSQSSQSDNVAESVQQQQNMHLMPIFVSKSSDKSRREHKKISSLRDRCDDYAVRAICGCDSGIVAFLVGISL